MRQLKLFTIFGTRPEFIRMSRLVAELDKVSDHFVLNTGQNFESSLSDSVFADLNIRRPDFVLNSKSSSLAETLGTILIGVEEALRKVRPDGVMILGDTNSSLAAIVAERLGFPVFHMEAGNRSFDSRVPEELNRRLVDHVSTYNLPYSEYARMNLLSEGLHPNNVCVTGSPMPEIIQGMRPQINESDALETYGVTPGGYFIVSAHRQETVNDVLRLTTLVRSISNLAEYSTKRVLLSANPRLRSNLLSNNLALGPGVTVLEPFSVVDYWALQMHSSFVFSDSGSLPEESGYLGFPAVIIRDSFERQESLDGGFIGLAGLEFNSWLRSMQLLESRQEADVPPEYLSENFTSKVINFTFSKLLV